ncbi:MAG: response regulator [Bacteroides sp.]|nr:response regulator [Bacteroides sp.]
MATPNINSSCISELTLYSSRIPVGGVGEENHPTEPKEEKTRMLIVEDNEELRSLLARLFSRVYTVYQTQDGQEGLIKTREIQPDIVLSDIMMPGMSGIEMCRKIKNNFDTSHIPVILLTAQTAEEYTMQELKMGADDCVTKPFNVKHLFMRCNNLVNSRKLLQQNMPNRQIAV